MGAQKRYHEERAMSARHLKDEIPSMEPRKKYWSVIPPFPASEKQMEVLRWEPKQDDRVHPGRQSICTSRRKRGWFSGSMLTLNDFKITMVRKLVWQLVSWSSGPPCNRGCTQIIYFPFHPGKLSLLLIIQLFTSAFYCTQTSWTINLVGNDSRDTPPDTFMCIIDSVLNIVMIAISRNQNLSLYIRTVYTIYIIYIINI